MPSELLIISSILIIGFIFLAVLIRSWILQSQSSKQPSEEILSYLRTSIERGDVQYKNFAELLQGNTRTLNERLDNAARVISTVQRSIGEMSEIGRSMKDLQEFLRSPKLRGTIGEHVLKELLGQMLPKQSFHLQYAFKSGMIVDAAIQTSNGIIPIDSKFPMENFRKLNSAETDIDREVARKLFVKDVRKHISDIATKYILTDEGTIDYALMYIPSEAVYYEIINDPDLFDYSHAKCVLPVSPMTFYAYMRAILMSFEGQKIEERAKEILKTIRSTQKDYAEIDSSLGILGRHLTNAYNQMNNVRSSFTLLGQKLNSSKSITEQTKEEIEQLKIQ